MKVNLLEKLLATHPRVGGITFIAVDGHGGSGKTTLAKTLAKNLNVQIIHTDDFAGWDNPLNWYTDVIEKIFNPIKDGAKSLSYQPASWWEDHHPEPVVNQPVTDIMILEGVSSSRKEFQEYISFSIFVDTPKEVCLQRGVERDLSTGKSKKEITEMWKKWLKEEDKYMQRDNPKEHADIIIDGTKSIEEQIDFKLCN